MSRPRIIVADTDESYLAALEENFIRLVGRRAELEFISDRGYFEAFCAAPQTAELLVVDEKLYTGELLRHNVNHLFVLTEEEGSGCTQELSAIHIYKYSNIRDIFQELLYRSRDVLSEDERERESQVIALYSAAGGSGKTCLGIGLAGALARMSKRVLYINTESVQDFACYLKDGSGLPREGYGAIRDDMQHIYRNIRHFIRREGFWYLPPLESTLDGMNLEFSLYKGLIAEAKDSREYDYILVDLEAGYAPERLALLQNADRAVMVVMQDHASACKTRYLLSNIECSDREKYRFVCCRYREQEENAYGILPDVPPIREYVGELPVPPRQAEELSDLKDIRRLAYMFV